MYRLVVCVVLAIVFNAWRDWAQPQPRTDLSEFLRACGVLR